MSEPPERYDAKAKAYADFEGMGVDHVRRQYRSTPDAAMPLMVKQRHSWAAEWLSEFDKIERLNTDAERAEAKRMARSAKYAAWAAAMAAIIAAIAAIASAVIAYHGLSHH